MDKTLYSRQHEVIPKMLRELRKSQRLRQSDLARLLGWSQAAVSNVERGERKLEILELLDWLYALEANVILFMTELEGELRGLGETKVGASLRKRPARQRA